MVWVYLVVEGLVDSATTHPLGLGATDVDVLEENAGGVLGSGHLLGDGDLLVDVGTSGLVEGLELVLGADVPVEDLLLETGDGVVGAAHALDLLTATVGGTGVDME